MKGILILFFLNIRHSNINKNNNNGIANENDIYKIKKFSSRFFYNVHSPTLIKMHIK